MFHMFVLPEGRFSLVISPSGTIKQKTHLLAMISNNIVHLGMICYISKSENFRSTVSPRGIPGDTHIICCFLLFYLPISWPYNTMMVSETVALPGDQRTCLSTARTGNILGPIFLSSSFLCHICQWSEVG